MVDFGGYPDRNCRCVVLPACLPPSLLALCCGTALAQSSGEPVPNGRLPAWAVPERYSLSFKIDPDHTEFSGRTSIRVQLKQASDHLWLHGKELKVSKVTITPAKSQGQRQAADRTLRGSRCAGRCGAPGFRPHAAAADAHHGHRLQRAAQSATAGPVPGEVSGPVLCDDADGADQRTLRVPRFRRARVQDSV
ncbi:exported hypothetical protein [Xanthomonas hortorum pv. vitians]|nr:exported hypothetical protein [Xanthomonas hortorum pv. vitians]